MHNLSTKIFEIAVNSFLLIFNEVPHAINISLLITEQEDKLSGVQIILIDSIPRVDGQITYF